MKFIIDARLAATEQELGELYLPRIVRLCRKFQFSELDSTIATHILVAQAACEHNEGRGGLEMDFLNCCNTLKNFPEGNVGVSGCRQTSHSARVLSRYPRRLHYG